MTTPEPKVVFVAGKGRSGSTLVDLLLGEIHGFVSTGELWRIWDAASAGHLCGCGEPVAGCELWRPVLAEALDGRDVADVARWQRRHLSWRSSIAVLASPGRVGSSGTGRSYLEVMARLYRAVAARSGARVVVDSSKWPVHPGLLGAIDGIDPYLLHLVRDPRAVAFSWQRRTARTDRPDESEMRRFSVAYSAASWTGRHLLTELTHTRVRSGAALRLRYEDLLAAPRSGLEAIAAMVGEPDADTSFIRGREAQLGPNHSVSGNPGRFRLGPTALAEDTEWRTAMSLPRRATVTLLCWPLMLRYGYRRAAAPASG